MPLVRFGEHYDWAPKILEYLDRTRFRYEFGPPDEERLGGVDVFVPLTLADIRRLSANPHLRSARALIPRPELVALANNKVKFYRYLQSQGFGLYVPRLYDSPSRFPLVAKAEFGSNGSAVWIVRDIEQWEALAKEHGRERLALSAYIPGSVEFAFHFLARNGEVVWSGAVKHDHRASGDTPYVRGMDDVESDSDRCDDFPGVAVLRAIVAQLGFNGTGCFDLKVVDGSPLIFELNPRPGFSFSFWINEYLDALLAHLPGAYAARLSDRRTLELDASPVAKYDARGQFETRARGGDPTRALDLLDKLDSAN